LKQQLIKAATHQSGNYTKQQLIKAATHQSCKSANALVSAQLIENIIINN
jgi:hypothetical protein